MVFNGNKLKRKLRSHVFRYLISWFPRGGEAPSSNPVSLLFPLAPKDLERARYTIPSVREYVNHDISKTYVVSPANDEIEEFCKQIGADYIVETDVLIDDVLGFLRGQGRLNGWYRQQFIKLSFPDFTNDKRIVVFDSDTRPVRPVTFWNDLEQVIFYAADEHNADFLNSVPPLIGGNGTYPYSFVSHCMGFEREKMLELHRLIEDRTGKPWQKGIMDCVDETCPTGFSEFELYGNFMCRFHRDEAQVNYWFNRKVDPDVFMSGQRLPPIYKRFNFISSHVK